MLEGYDQVTDPLGNQVCIPRRFHAVLDEPDEMYDDLVAVVQSPMMIIELKNGKEELHYFRAIGWNITVLVSSARKDRTWEVFECHKNPTIETITELISKGKQLV